MIFKRHHIISIMLSACVLLETLALTYMQENGAILYYSSSIIYFICGLAICIIPIIPIITEEKSVKNNKIINKAVPYLGGLFIITLVFYQIILLIPLYKNVPCDKTCADMLPSIQIACQRFLHGKTIYGPVPELYPGSVIPYLPFMWIPFLPAVIFAFDLRWITFIVQFLGITLAFIPILKRLRNISLVSLIIACIGCFLLLNFLVVKRTDYWSMTEEGVVAGFYLLLSFALLRKNYWLIGLAIMGCTLSRYSLIFWIPVYFSYVFFTQPRSNFWKLFLSFSVSISAFFVIPFFVKDPLYFIRIPIAYTQFNSRFWLENRIDEHLYFNVGLFKFFKLKDLHIMSILEIITSFVAPLVFILSVLWLKKRNALNGKYIAFASFKMSLIFFFGFIQMPYLYIFVPATIISYTLLLDYLALDCTSVSTSVD